MSYEVYIDVKHHAKHLDEWEQTEDTCFKYTDLPPGSFDLVYVVNGLRDFADAIDPRVKCEHCGELRGNHHREGGLYRCFNRMGPITQHDWWGSPVEERT